MCMMHKHTPVSYVCKYSKLFYCKHCISRHHDHDDQPLTFYQNEIQKEINELKHVYFKKRVVLMDRVLKHKSEVDRYFEIYFKALRDLREQVLKDELHISRIIEKYDADLKHLCHVCCSFSNIEAYVEMDSFKRKAQELKRNLENFEIYLPSYQVTPRTYAKSEEEFSKVITNQLKESFMAHMTKLDQSFAISNYNYILTQTESNHLKQTYQLLGPLNYKVNESLEFESSFDLKLKEELLLERRMLKEFEERKSKAMYRGEVNQETWKPDGKGIKIFKGKSLFEGYFSDGNYHGYGRAISSKNEVYEGFFKYDTMHGKGFFSWPDGRIYEGDWENN